MIRKKNTAQKLKSAILRRQAQLRKGRLLNSQALQKDR